MNVPEILTKVDLKGSRRANIKLNVETPHPTKQGYINSYEGMVLLTEQQEIDDERAFVWEYSFSLEAFEGEPDGENGLVVECEYSELFVFNCLDEKEVTKEEISEAGWIFAITCKAIVNQKLSELFKDTPISSLKLGNYQNLHHLFR